MSLVLHIDTSGPEAWVVLAVKGEVLAFTCNNRQQDHAAFLHSAILRLMNESGRTLRDLQAVAVCAGPGSYTGIRVGMAAAKGICYALNIPLVIFNALECSARALRDADETAPVSSLPVCYAPMIDARRMEVFTAVYDQALLPLLEPCSMILEPDSYVKILLNNRVIFSGTGAAKWQRAGVPANAGFATEQHRERAMACISWEKIQRGEFADLVYTEPMYLKEFYTGSSRM